MPAKTKKVSYKDNDIPKVSLEIMNDDFMSDTVMSDTGTHLNSNILNLESDLNEAASGDDRGKYTLDPRSVVRLAVLGLNLYSSVLLWIFFWMMLMSFNPSWVSRKDEQTKKIDKEKGADPIKALGWSLLITFVLGMIVGFFTHNHLQFEVPNSLMGD